MRGLTPQHDMSRKERPIHTEAFDPTDAEVVVGLIEASLADHKAEDLVAIDLAGKTDYADAMVIASGQSARHVGALADHLVEALKGAGLRPSVEGAAQCDWVLIDAGDVVVHLFRPEVRAFYNLEKMWGLPGAPVRSMGSPVAASMAAPVATPVAAMTPGLSPKTTSRAASAVAPTAPGVMAAVH